MIDDDTLDTVYYQGRPSLVDFIQEAVTFGRRVTLGCFRVIEGQEEPELCGLGWAMNAVGMGKYVKADCGMVFFKKQTCKTDNLTFGKMMLRCLFINHAIDCLYGYTPSQNKLALRYAKGLGMSLHGPIPGYCYWKGELADGWISHISKQQFLERNP